MSHVFCICKTHVNLSLEMDKPYTIVEHNDYKLTIYRGIAPFDSNNNNVDVEVTFPNGDSFSAVFFTLQNIETLMKRYEKTGECADGLYFWTSDMVIVQKLSEKNICATIDRLLAEDEFESVFSKNQKSIEISSDKEEDYFRRFNETL